MKKPISYLFLVVLLSSFLVSIVSIKNAEADTSSDALRTEQVKIKTQVGNMYENMNSYYDRLMAIGKQASEPFGESRNSIAKQFLTSSNLFAQALGKFASLSTESTRQNDESYFKNTAKNYYQFIQKYNKYLSDNISDDKEKISLSKDPETLLFDNFYNKKAEEVTKQIETQQKAQEASKQKAAEATGGTNECWKQCQASQSDDTAWDMGGFIGWLSSPFQQMLCNLQCMLVGLIMEFLNFIQTILGQVPI